MAAILNLGIIWTLYGIAGILGFQVIKKEYRNHDWTKKYIRYRGMTWLIFGILLLILYQLTHGRDINKLVMCFLVLLCGAPSFTYAMINDQKYQKLLKEK